MTGFAYEGGGWAKTATGQIKRADDVRHKAARLLRPFWGPVLSEAYRGNQLAPPKMVDSIGVQAVDRIYLLLSPLTAAGEVTLTRVACQPAADRPKFIYAVIEGVDQHRRPWRLVQFIPTPGSK